MLARFKVSLRLTVGGPVGVGLQVVGALFLGWLFWGAPSAQGQGGDGPTYDPGTFKHVNYWICERASCTDRTGLKSFPRGHRDKTECQVEGVRSKREAELQGDCGHSAVAEFGPDSGFRYDDHVGVSNGDGFWFCDANGNRRWDVGEVRVANQTASCVVLGVVGGVVVEGGVVRFGLSGVGAGVVVRWMIEFDGSASAADFRSARSGTSTGSAVLVWTVDDVLDEPDRETFMLRVWVDDRSRSVSAVGTILDNDRAGDIQLSVVPSRVEESAGSVQVRVMAQFSGSTRVGRAVPVRVRVAGGSARAGRDFLASPATFTISIPAGAGSGSGVFTLRVVDDSLGEGDETVRVSGSAGGFRVVPAEIVVLDDDVGDPYFTVSGCPGWSWQDGQRVNIRNPQLPRVMGVFNRPSGVGGGIRYDWSRLDEQLAEIGVERSSRGLRGVVRLPEGRSSWRGGAEVGVVWETSSGGILYDEFVYCSITVTGTPRWWGECNVEVVAGQRFETDQIWYGWESGPQVGLNEFDIGIPQSLWNDRLGGDVGIQYGNRRAVGGWSPPRKAKIRLAGRVFSPGTYTMRVGAYRPGRWQTHPNNAVSWKDCTITVLPADRAVWINDATPVMEGEQTIFPVQVPEGLTGSFRIRPAPPGQGPQPPAATYGLDYRFDPTGLTPDNNGWWTVTLTGADTQIGIITFRDRIAEPEETVTLQVEGEDGLRVLDQQGGNSPMGTILDGPPIPPGWQGGCTISVTAGHPFQTGPVWYGEENGTTARDVRLGYQLPASLSEGDTITGPPLSDYGSEEAVLVDRGIKSKGLRPEADPPRA